MKKYQAIAEAGSDVHIQNVPEFDSIEQGIEFFTIRAWRLVSETEQIARMELWINHGETDDPMQKLLNNMPDAIVFIR